MTKGSEELATNYRLQHPDSHPPAPPAQLVGCLLRRQVGRADDVCGVCRYRRLLHAPQLLRPLLHDRHVPVGPEHQAAAREDLRLLGGGRAGAGGAWRFALGRMAWCLASSRLANLDRPRLSCSGLGRACRLEPRVPQEQPQAGNWASCKKTRAFPDAQRCL